MGQCVSNPKDKNNKRNSQSNNKYKKSKTQVTGCACFTKPKEQPTKLHTVKTPTFKVVYDEKQINLKRFTQIDDLIREISEKVVHGAQFTLSHEQDIVDTQHDYDEILKSNENILLYVDLAKPKDVTLDDWVVHIINSRKQPIATGIILFDGTVLTKAFQYYDIQDASIRMQRGASAASNYKLAGIQLSDNKTFSLISIRNFPNNWSSVTLKFVGMSLAGQNVRLTTIQPGNTLQASQTELQAFDKFTYLLSKPLEQTQDFGAPVFIDNQLVGITVETENQSTCAIISVDHIIGEFARQKSPRIVDSQGYHDRHWRFRVSRSCGTGELRQLECGCYCCGAWLNSIVVATFSKSGAKSRYVCNHCREAITEQNPIEFAKEVLGEDDFRSRFICDTCGKFHTGITCVKTVKEIAALCPYCGYEHGYSSWVQYFESQQLSGYITLKAASIEFEKAMKSVEKLTAKKQSEIDSIEMIILRQRQESFLKSRITFKSPKTIKGIIPLQEKQSKPQLALKLEENSTLTTFLVGKGIVDSSQAEKLLTQDLVLFDEDSYILPVYKVNLK